MHAMLFPKLVDHADQQLDVVAKVGSNLYAFVHILLSRVFTFFYMIIIFIAADTSAYVEYSSSSDEEESAVNRSKPAKRRRDESDSGSDVRKIDSINRIISKDLKSKFWKQTFCVYSTIHRDQVIRMREERVQDFQHVVGHRQEADVVRVVADPLRRKRNHHRHPMMISAMNRKKRKHQHVPVVVHRHVAEVAKQKKPNQKSVKRTRKRYLNPKATKAR